MFYGKGGFAASTIESTIVDSAGGLGPGTGKRDVLGWAWGAGLEYVFAQKWSIKAEYLGLGFNHTVGVCAGVAPGFPPAGGTFCGNTTTQFVQKAKVGINYLFDVGPVYERY
jgi:outer membrane immunogenic protein